MLEEWSKLLSENAFLFWRASAWAGLLANLGMNRYSSSAHPFFFKGNYFLLQDCSFIRKPPSPPLDRTKNWFFFLLCEKWMTNFACFCSKIKQHHGSDPLWQRAGTASDTVTQIQSWVPPSSPIAPWKGQEGISKAFFQKPSHFWDYFGLSQTSVHSLFILSSSPPDLPTHSPSSASEVASPPGDTLEVCWLLAPAPQPVPITIAAGSWQGWWELG